MVRYSSPRVGLWAALLVVGALAARPAAAAPDLTSLADQVFVLVNQQRAARGLQPLARVGALDRCAQDYAVRMAREGFFAHTAPDGSTPDDRIAATGYQAQGWGENIAAGQQSADAVMQAWMNSPGHAANILNANFTQIGIGVAAGGNYGIQWVQNFGRPFTSAPPSTAPSLGSMSPSTPPAGAQVTLSGSNLGSPGRVTFGGVGAVIEQWSTGSVIVRVPSGGTGAVVLTNAQGSSNPLSLGGISSPPPPPTVTTQLLLQGIQPSRGISGTTVRLVGTAFGASPGQVRVENATATVLSWSDTSISVRISGPNRGRHEVRVVRADGQVSNWREFRQTR
jgi:uncharacterized protein YkwD